MYVCLIRVFTSFSRSMLNFFHILPNILSLPHWTNRTLFGHHIHHHLHARQALRPNTENIYVNLRVLAYKELAQVGCSFRELHSPFQTCDVFHCMQYNSNGSTELSIYQLTQTHLYHLAFEGPP